VAVDRGARKLEGVVARFEVGIHFADVLSELRDWHALVNSGAA
jgi:hypothetical protein